MPFRYSHKFKLELICMNISSTKMIKLLYYLTARRRNNQCYFSWHWIQHQEIAIRGIRRNLKERAKLVFKTYSVASSAAFRNCDMSPSSAVIHTSVDSTDRSWPSILDRLKNSSADCNE